MSAKQSLCTYGIKIVIFCKPHSLVHFHQVEHTDKNIETCEKRTEGRLTMPQEGFTKMECTLSIIRELRERFWNCMEPSFIWIQNVYSTNEISNERKLSLLNVDLEENGKSPVCRRYARTKWTESMWKMNNAWGRETG